MPIPPPPPPPGPPPAPTFNQANTAAPKLHRDEAKGRGALLSDICKGTKLKKTSVVNDRSAPIIETRGGSSGGGGGGAGPMGGLFSGGVPKLRPVGDSSVGRSAVRPPASRLSVPRAPGNSEPASSSRATPPEQARNQRPSLPDFSKTSATSSSSKPTTSAPPPPLPFSRGGNRGPSPGQQGSGAHSREKPFPEPPASKGPTLPPSSPRDGPSRHPPVSSRFSSSSSPSSNAPPPYRQPTNAANGNSAPELPQRRNSLNKRSHANAQAPPPPPPAHQNRRPAPPSRDPVGRSTAPQVIPHTSHNGVRQMPPPYRGPQTSSEPPSRGKPPPLSSTGRQSSGHAPPPPPPLRNGHASSTPKSFSDDFESKYSFHPIADLPPPEEYRPFQKIYPSQNIKTLVRGVPPLPPVGGR
ncbi:WAS/WASL-interacting protein family member 2 [Carassius gibelio]|uniref:WAS/WASL-interacting protein family member 2 n=1 Tax=Carassius gibelio TaxID=101364 RepID=UPI00227758B4|nr:WAS/WASL-interacting protein family member 2 [Carassius gibelio]XP_052466065.1 WAS/WASL-interacting protein family member 2 [Carassius gibelio]XP_052466066.1 WAS/WASL-interacting protein family member 2 [Carassius gibelio]